MSHGGAKTLDTDDFATRAEGLSHSLTVFKVAVSEFYTKPHHKDYRFSKNMIEGVKRFRLYALLFSTCEPLYEVYRT